MSQRSGCNTSINALKATQSSPIARGTSSLTANLPLHSQPLTCRGRKHIYQFSSFQYRIVIAHWNSHRYFGSDVTITVAFIASHSKRWVTLMGGRSKTEVHNRGPHAQNGRDQKVALGMHLQASENFKHENRLYFWCIATATQPRLGKCVGWAHCRSTLYFILIRDYGNLCMSIYSECSMLLRLECGC